MKKRYYLFYCAFMIAQILNAESLDERKAALERQIREIESQQAQRAIEEQKKQKEVEELEQKLKALQYSYPKEKSQKNLVQQDFAQNNKITQELDKDADKMFGKNRSGVLIGISAGLMPMEYQTLLHSVKGDLGVGGARLGYQYFSHNNSIFGFRIYTDAHIGRGQTENTLTQIKQDFMAWNFDVLVDVRIPNTYSYIGFFGGVGLGSLNFEITDILDYAYLKGGRNFYNFGLAFTGGAKHRLELYCKMPIKSSYNENFYWKSSMLVSIAYQYTF
ncbi:outer membrane beta-barrel protein [Helicobacter typhlonius]|uniref:outer membrane beta-barrel protein n=1 Tax=Helicobacter typhlonius TaxID=76936 RepID=UPI002FE0CEFF